MRKPIIAGNWKMNKLPCEGAELVEALKAKVADAKCDVVVCVPFVDLCAVVKAAEGSNIKVGAQNMHWEKSGAYTGEISADMLKAVGAEYVVLGHSERRQYFAETDETVNKKVLVAVDKGLTPIICVGESLAQRENGETDGLVSMQTVKALAGLTGEQVKNVVIAYEPIWAIGTGKTASRGRDPHPVRRLHERQELRGAYGAGRDRRRPDRRRVAQGGGLLHHRGRGHRDRQVRG